VENLPVFVNKLLEILDVGGRVVVASTTHQQFYDLPYCQSSEAVLKLELARTPDEPKIIEEFEKKGLTLLNRVSVDTNRQYESKKDIEAWLDSSPFSVLAYLSKQQFVDWKEKFMSLFGKKSELVTDKMVILTFEREN
jgi:hypothetical protein